LKNHNPTKLTVVDTNNLKSKHQSEIYIPSLAIPSKRKKNDDETETISKL